MSPSNGSLLIGCVRVLVWMGFVTTVVGGNVTILSNGSLLIMSLSKLANECSNGSVYVFGKGEMTAGFGVSGEGAGTATDFGGCGTVVGATDCWIGIVGCLFSLFIVDLLLRFVVVVVGGNVLTAGLVTA